jgi:hypothetical protein
MARKITIQIKGDPSENESLRIVDFIYQLDAIRTALFHLESEIAGPGSPHMVYRLVDLLHQSPATVVIELVPHPKGQDLSDLVADSFMERIEFIKSGKVPEKYDSSTLEVFKNIGPRMVRGSAKKEPKKYFSGVSIDTNSAHVDISKSLESEINKIVGPDEIIQGSISGTLELINVHAHANTFRIYPVVGPKKVDCVFKDEQLSNAIAGINKHVNVTGALRYKSRDKFPYAVNDAIIEVYPDDKDLPSIFDLRGIAPNATGGMASEEFVAKLRTSNG